MPTQDFTLRYNLTCRMPTADVSAGVYMGGGVWPGGLLTWRLDSYSPFVTKVRYHTNKVKQKQMFVALVRCRANKQTHWDGSFCFFSALVPCFRALMCPCVFTLVNAPHVRRGRPPGDPSGLRHGRRSVPLSLRQLARGRPGPCTIEIMHLQPCRSILFAEDPSHMIDQLTYRSAKAG
jgi:hypothetical protein